MKKRLLCALVVSTLTAFAQNVDKPAAAAPPVRPVAVLISATDANGNPVRDLSKEQLRARAGEVAATLADLRPVGDAPLSLGIVLLASKTNFAKEQAAAVDLVQKLIRPDKDRAFVITAGGEKPWTQATLDWQNDSDALIKAIRALDKNSGVPDAFSYELSTYGGDNTMSSSRMQIETYSGAGRSVFDAAWAMMMADRRPARRVLVVFRNAWAHAPGLSQRNRDLTDAKHQQLIAVAQRLHVTVHTIGVEEPSPASSAATNDIKTTYGQNYSGDATREADRQIRLENDRLYSGGRSNVERMAAETGGHAWWSGKNNYADAVTGIANQLAGQYLLTFVPASDAPGSHPLNVDSGRARIAAPTAFLVAPPAAPAATPAK